MAPTPRHRSTARPSGLLPFVPAQYGSGELALDLGGYSAVAQGAIALKSTGSARVPGARNRLLR